MEFFQNPARYSVHAVCAVFNAASFATFVLAVFFPTSRGCTCQVESTGGTFDGGGTTRRPLMWARSAHWPVSKLA
jgi:hypothetical protein